MSGQPYNTTSNQRKHKRKQSKSELNALHTMPSSYKNARKTSRHPNKLTCVRANIIIVRQNKNVAKLQHEQTLAELCILNFERRANATVPQRNQVMLHHTARATYPACKASPVPRTPFLSAVLSASVIASCVWQVREASGRSGWKRVRSGSIFTMRPRTVPLPRA